MFSAIWNLFLVNPILNLLVSFYRVSGNLGIAIILLTVSIRVLLLPIVIPSIKSMKKQRDLQPELEKIRKKYKYDKQKQAEMQMQLLKERGVNPASGCITQLSMLFIFAALYSVIRKFSSGVDPIAINDLIYFDFLKFLPGEVLRMNFLYLDLTRPDPYYVLAVLSGLLQFLYSKMVQPFADVGEKAAGKTPDKSDDIAYNMQEQMLYLMPMMIAIVSIRLPAGVVLNIFTTTLFMLIQQYLLSGPGGLKPYLVKVGIGKKK